jgi:hypothetical protein
MDTGTAEVPLLLHVHTGNGTSYSIQPASATKGQSETAKNVWFTMNLSVLKQELRLSQLLLLHPPYSLTSI